MPRSAKAKPPKRQPKPKAKIGRPPKIVDDERTLQTLAGLARIQCTTKEGAAVLGVSEPTFIDFLKRSAKARETWDNNQQSGRASLRRMQFKTAESGNATMQIWLGKQFLGQRDKSETELTGKDGGPVSMTGDFTVKFVTCADASG